MRYPASPPGAVLWLTGLPGAGKLALAQAVAGRLGEAGYTCYHLESDRLHYGLNVGQAAALLADAGLLCIVSRGSCDQADQVSREQVRKAVRHFHEIHVAVAPATREPHNGAGTHLADLGTSSAYHLPLPPDLCLEMHHESLEAGVERLYRYVIDAIPLGRPPGAPLELRHGQALHLYRNGQVAEALHAMARLIEDAPNAPLAHCALAEMLREQGQPRQAVTYGERAVTLSPAMASAHSNLGLAWFDLNNLDRAEACHSTALRLQPSRAASLNGLANIAHARGQLDIAIEGYRKALLVRPDYPEALCNLGTALMDAHRLDDAVHVLEQAMELAPNSADILCALGLARLQQSRAAQARRLFEQALQLSPGHTKAAAGLARSMAKSDQRQSSNTQFWG